MSPTKPKRPAIPYVMAEVIGAHLVRVCPECKEQIAERTDGDGLVSNHFVEHYEAKHRELEVPKRCVYVLGHEKFPQLDYEALEHARRQFGDEINFTLVRGGEFMEIPEGEFVLFVRDIIRSGFSDDPADRDIRWYVRDGDRLVFRPSERQAGHLTASHRRLDELFKAVEADVESVGPRKVHSALLELIVAEMNVEIAYFKAGRWLASKATAQIAYIETQRLAINARIEHEDQGLCRATTRVGKLCLGRAIADGYCRRHHVDGDPEVNHDPS